MAGVWKVDGVAEVGLPSGTVTFLFTDVEGSTSLWATDAEGMSASLLVHDRTLTDEFEQRGGYVFATAGDSFCVAFQRVSDALTAAAAAQRSLAAADWPGPELRVRMGLHLGEADERDGDYFGSTVNLAARVEAAGHGGQVLMTDAVRSATGIAATDLGEHRLRDVSDPVRIWQLGDGIFPALRTANARSNLPVAATRLLGRDVEVRTVRVLLSEHRLVTLLATGGAGKTRLALAVGEAELEHRRDGVCFVDLTTAEDDSGVGPAVAAALDLEPDSSDYHREITRYLADRRMLLILDNCEHVIDGCADLAATVLTDRGHSVLLATSREWLDVEGERVFRVPALACDSAESAAVRLFADRAAAISPDFELDDDNLPPVMEICQRLDGLPLAIELAASRVATMSPSMIAAGLDDRFGLLSSGRRRRRRQALEATIDWSYDLLDDDERRIFRSLGVFAGSFDLRAVAAISDYNDEHSTHDLVESLVGRSLVTPSDEVPDRFRLLETIRAYAEDRLDAEDERQLFIERHASHFVERAYVEDPLDVDDRFRQARLRPDQANLLLAADVLERQKRWNELAGLLHSMAPLDVTAAPLQLERVERCLAYPLSAASTDRLRWAAAYLHLSIGQIAEFIRRARELERSGDPRLRGMGHLMIALAAGQTAPDYALDRIERFEALWGDEPTLAQRIAAASYRCMTAAQSNDLSGAQKAGDEVRRLYRGNYLPEEAEIALAISGVPGWVEGDTRQLAEVIELLAAIEPRRHRTFALVDFASALVALAEEGPTGSEAVRRYALDAVSRVNMLDTDALVLLAELARSEGDVDRAIDLIRSTGAGRTPMSILVGQQTAQRLGVIDEFQADFLEHMKDAAWATERPKRALRAELQRRGWLAD